MFDLARSVLTVIAKLLGDDMWDNEWSSKAACRAAEPDQLFVSGADQHKAKAICSTCPVRAQCLAEALDNRIEWGVWGGMTERERRALLRSKPVASWSTVLQAATAQASA